MKFLNSRGQISAEMIVSVAAVLILFVIVLGNNALMEDSTKIISASIDDKKSCIEFAYIITQVYAGGKGSLMQIDLVKNFTVDADQKTLFVNNESCFFLAVTDDKTLSAGAVSVYNNGSKVVVN
jgi:hypothetical protein